MGNKDVSRRSYAVMAWFFFQAIKSPLNAGISSLFLLLFWIVCLPCGRVVNQAVTLFIIVIIKPFYRPLSSSKRLKVELTP